MPRVVEGPRVGEVVYHEMIQVGHHHHNEALDRLVALEDAVAGLSK